jgi:hypothetical protein
MFDNLYLLNGTVFIVTDEPNTVPDRKTITSTAVKIDNGAVAVASRLPTDRELRVISTDDARELFGASPVLIDGATVNTSMFSHKFQFTYVSQWIVNDPPQLWVIRGLVENFVNMFFQHYTLLPLVCGTFLRILADIFVTGSFHSCEWVFFASRSAPSMVCTRRRGPLEGLRVDEPMGFAKCFPLALRRVLRRLAR